MLEKKELKYQHFVLNMVAKTSMLPIEFNRTTGKLTVTTSFWRLKIFKIFQLILLLLASFTSYRTTESLIIRGFVLKQSPMLILWAFSYVGSYISIHHMFVETGHTTVLTCNEFNYTEESQQRGGRRSVREYILIFFPVMMLPLLCAYPVAYAMTPDLPSLLISVLPSEHPIAVTLCLSVDMLAQVQALNIANFVVYFLLTFESKFMTEVNEINAIMMEPDSEDLLPLGYAHIRKSQLAMHLMNMSFSRPAFIGKVVCIVAASFCGFAAIRLLSTGESVSLGLVYLATSVDGTVAFISMFHGCHHMTHAIEKLKRNLLRSSSEKSFANLSPAEQAIKRAKQKETKMVVRSVPRLTVKSEVRAVEQEAVPSFCHFSVDQAVSLLLTVE